MSTEDDREKSREESPKWHRARAARLRANGFAKMAEEHEQVAEIIERRRQQEPGSRRKEKPRQGGAEFG